MNDKFNILGHQFFSPTKSNLFLFFLQKNVYLNME